MKQTDLTRRRFLQLTGLGGVALGAAACTTVATPAQPSPATKATGKASPTPAPKPKAKALTSLRYGYVSPKADTGFFYMAKHKGYFEEVGLDVEYVFVDDDNVLRTGIVAGDLDIVTHTPIVMVPAIASGAPVKIIGSDFPRWPHVLLVQDEINSLEDLYDQPVGIISRGSTFDLLMIAVFRKHGLDIERVERVGAGGSAGNFQALAAGQIAAGPAGIEFTRMLPEAPGVKVLFSFGEELPDLPRTCLLASDELIGSNPEAIEGFVTAYARGIRYAIENPEEYVDVVEELSGLDREDIAWTHEHFVSNRLIDPDLAFTPESLAQVETMLQDSGVLEGEITFDEAADMRFQESMVAELGSYSWPS